jgi:hypothetical protein
MVYVSNCSSSSFVPDIFTGLDPTGAIIVRLLSTVLFNFLTMSKIAIGIVLSWSRTIYREFELLAGKSASHDFLQLLIYKVATFSDEIEKVDTLRAYHVCVVSLT